MNVKTLISAICIFLAIFLAIYFWGEWEMARFDASLPTSPPEPADEQQAVTDELIPTDDWQPSTGRPHEAVKPEGLDELDADDPVAKAWAKLDYIADNPFAWGGNADPRTPGLIAQLIPPPVELAPEGSAEDNSEDLIMLLEELARLRDPRSIETFIAYQCESPIGGAPIREALVAMGPPTVPHLIPYLDEALKAKTEENPIVLQGLLSSLGILTGIGHRRWADLDGVTEHIILPRLEQMLAEGFLSPYGEREVQWAIDALKR